ncbi:MAG: zinc dependent phospholipase C family protein [Siphonobacter sp.]
MKSLLVLLFLIPQIASGWGFYAHQRINRLAIFTLPPEMNRFYKKNLAYLMEHSVDPDKRRYAVPGEAARHYFDREAYGDSAWAKPYWKDALIFWGADTLNAHGIVPWHIQLMKYQLTEAFKERNLSKILKLSAEMGHYIADGNVPLHTTRNYNGQLTQQEGIHAFWESRLPELYAESYDFFVGPAEYVQSIQKRSWQAVQQAHHCLDSLFLLETQITQKLGQSRKYAFEERNTILQKTYSREFSQAYHLAINQQVERQMRAAIKMTGDFWYTCWIDAGQPDLNSFPIYQPSEEEKQEERKEKLLWLKRLFKVREEETALN